MLADASISRADISKAKPPAPRPAIEHTHAVLRSQRGVASGGVGGSGGAAYRLQETAAEEEGRRAVAAEERRGHRRGEEGRRGRRVGEGRRGGDGDVRRGLGGRTLARPSSPAAGDGVARVLGRSGASGRSGTACWRGAAWRVGEEGRGGDECGEERRRRGRARRGRTAQFGGKRLSALEGLYRTPPFVTVRITNRDKSPLSLDSYYEPRLNVPLLSRVDS
jgi:hypothetical protein